MIRPLATSWLHVMNTLQRNSNFEQTHHGEYLVADIHTLRTLHYGKRHQLAVMQRWTCLKAFETKDGNSTTSSFYGWEPGPLWGLVMGKLPCPSGVCPIVNARSSSLWATAFRNSSTLHSLQIYAMHLLMPTELHSGHGGPSVALVFTSWQGGSYVCAFF